jgi:hypothetical protein
LGGTFELSEIRFTARYRHWEEGTIWINISTLELIRYSNGKLIREEASEWSQNRINQMSIYFQSPNCETCWQELSACFWSTGTITPDLRKKLGLALSTKYVMV